MLRDPSFFSWHPLYLLTSLLAGTPWRLAIVDVNAFALMMLATAGFTVLAHYLRGELALAVSDGWITFLALSYTYTMIALTTGASWQTFLGNHSALPWLALGILQRSWARGTGLVALFSLHQIIGGHLEPTVSNTIFLSLFALGLGISRRSAVPLLNWGLGYAAAVILLLPLLVPMLEGFAQSARAGGTTLQDMQANNIPAEFFPMSVFLGMASWWLHPHSHPYVTYTLALGSGAAAWCLLPALCSRAKWRGLEVVALALLAFATVLIIRPFFITEIMSHLPLFKSMRWPFREFVQFQFFLHLFILVRPPGLSLAARRMSAAFGTFVYVVPLVTYSFAPTFNTMTWDRELLISGGAARLLGAGGPAAQARRPRGRHHPAGALQGRPLRGALLAARHLQLRADRALHQRLGLLAHRPARPGLHQDLRLLSLRRLSSRTTRRAGGRAPRPEIHHPGKPAPAEDHAELPRRPDHRPHSLRARAQVEDPAGGRAAPRPA
ncbi:MAG: hypothetical protein WDO13_00960 [Verrucomicrobiota bacterium]